jgi:hypothetical protein
MRHSERGMPTGLLWGCSAFCIPHSAIELVGSAGNAPVVASGLFDDTAFTVRQPDHFPGKLRMTNRGCRNPKRVPP